MIRKAYRCFGMVMDGVVNLWMITVDYGWFGKLKMVRKTYGWSGKVRYGWEGYIWLGKVRYG